MRGKEKEGSRERNFSLNAISTVEREMWNSKSQGGKRGKKTSEKDRDRHRDRERDRDRQRQGLGKANEGRVGRAMRVTKRVG